MLNISNNINQIRLQQRISLNNKNRKVNEVVKINLGTNTPNYRQQGEFDFEQILDEKIKKMKLKNKFN